MMKAHKGYYSLIQYCPDRGRAEVANVGVLLFCPTLHFIDVRMSKTNKRVRKIFGKDIVDSIWLKEIKQSIVNTIRHNAERFGQFDDLQQYISTRANEIIFTEPRTMRVEHPENDLKELFTEYVYHELTQEKITKLKSIRVLDTMFQRLSKKLSTIKISHTFDVSEYPHKVHADYAYNNGCTNLVRLLLIGLNPASTIARAVQLGGESIYIGKNLKIDGRRAKLIVVSAPKINSEAKDLEPRLHNLLGDYSTEFIQSNQVKKYAALVEKEAH